MFRPVWAVLARLAIGDVMGPGWTQPRGEHLRDMHREAIAREP
jgi:hypothetical protein